jgi:hypothetical protein
MRKVSQQSDPRDLREGQIRRQQRRESRNAVAPILARNPRWVYAEPRHVVTAHMPRIGVDRHRGEVVYQERLVGLLA